VLTHAPRQPKPWLIFNVSQRMITTAQEFCRLRESTIPEEYWRAAHEEASVEVWREIIAVRPDMRTWVAHNKTIPLEILEELSFDSDVAVRCEVAGKRKISEAIAVRLAKDPDEGVRIQLIYNQKLPAAALIVLRDDPSEFVRQTLHEKRG
jgi:hypothetical protein